MDVFSYGLLLHYCLAGGKHPFGARYERDHNILQACPRPPIPALPVYSRWPDVIQARARNLSLRLDDVRLQIWRGSSPPDLQGPEPGFSGRLTP